MTQIKRTPKKMRRRMKETGRVKESPVIEDTGRVEKEGRRG